VGILLTGNYNFFNLLTIVLALACMDDLFFCRLSHRFRALFRPLFRLLPRLFRPFRAFVPFVPFVLFVRPFRRRPVTGLATDQSRGDKEDRPGAKREDPPLSHSSQKNSECFEDQPASVGERRHKAEAAAAREALAAKEAAIRQR
jgi:hypothetical protein